MFAQTTRKHPFKRHQPTTAQLEQYRAVNNPSIGGCAMHRLLRSLSVGILFVGAGCGLTGDSEDPVNETSDNLLSASNEFGTAETFHVTGAVDFTNPFFQQLGTNPRT